MLLGLLSEALRRELKLVEEITRKQSQETDPLLTGEECIIASGAGDSYAAALAAEAVEAGRVTAVDPLDALVTPLTSRLAGRCTLLALSVGGRTRSLVELARSYKEHGGRVLAVTADSSSPLARVASEVVLLVYGGLARGVGAVRHLAMLSALARLVSGVRAEVKQLSGECSWLASQERAVFTGSAESFSAAIFSALKLYEVFGSPVRYERLEQLLHAPLFSLSRVVLFQSAVARPQRLEEVVGVLRSSGFEVYVVEASGRPWDNVVSQSHKVLECLAEISERLGIDDPIYRRHPHLDVLTNLIYVGL
ncbi:MAG: SIS domain-containing protein [Thermoproteota archaeon]